ncbi:hypothetical protein [Frondihabitans australicus]|uniref:MmyB-like transcription regulator ligand binding domain-containing protein n=1 Tax=Frondihabitans australicus TaxID=386892 RepID=A0A495ILL1_9MICO|nr:hypothetical protein [Frondihabitans australicus]RKR76318.1 hypothetical protein C8E83_3487 [Frondihabitans australicus]
MTSGGIDCRVPGALVALVESVHDLPVVVRDRHMTVVASNPLAQELTGAFVPRTNIARFVFLEAPRQQDASWWVDALGQLTSALRDSLEQHEEDASFRELIGELSAHSQTFATAWAHDNRPAARSSRVTIMHSQIGPVELEYQELLVPNDFEFVLSIWRPVDSQESVLAFTRLRQLLDA